MTNGFVVVGGGVAAAAAVQGLRERGFDGRIVVVGEEREVPYERPPLSKEYLRGEQGRDSLPVHPDGWYRDHDVELRLGVRATALDPAAPAVTLEGGERLEADGVLLATGGRARRMPGEPSDRVLYLRRVGDADRIRDVIRSGRLVVVGAGFIGAEVAASARVGGAEVTVLEKGQVPLNRAIGEEMGRIYAGIHRDHGVELRTEDGVASVEETAEGVVVRTEQGAVIEAGAVLVGIGIEPNIELAADAGLEIDNGLAVDERLATSAPGVFAAGDIANHLHPTFGRRIRVEHFDNALKMGTHVAGSMMGDQAPFTDPHWFWSDQYDVNLQYAGFAYEWDDIVVRGSMEDLDGVAFYLLKGVLLGALGLNRGRDVRRAMKLIGSRPDRAGLADDGTDLRALSVR
ncbi:MAG TPA: FAD-dependent oxidoreductase [Actinomycetota bacterium]|nr:FAD-dependent oxidoreductase [Actinomycetota bacterium]